MLSTDRGHTWNEVSTASIGSPYVADIAVLDGYLFVEERDSIYRLPLPPSSDVYTKVSSPSSLLIYPNPISQSTSISFTPDASAYAEISIVNLLGVEVARLFSGEVSAGEQHFTWNPVDMPDGMYECIIRTHGRVETLPLVLTR